jgi:hypothetical protein
MEAIWKKEVVDVCGVACMAAARGKVQSRLNPQPRPTVAADVTSGPQNIGFGVITVGELAARLPSQRERLRERERERESDRESGWLTERLDVQREHLVVFHQVYDVHSSGDGRALGGGGGGVEDAGDDVWRIGGW